MAIFREPPPEILVLNIIWCVLLGRNCFCGTTAMASGGGSAGLEPSSFRLAAELYGHEGSVSRLACVFVFIE